MAKNRKVKSFETCQMCLHAPTEPGAHIYSRGFYKRIADGEKLHAIPADPTMPVEPGYMGPKDYGIHCKRCEERFQLYDKYAVEALDLEPVPIDERTASLPSIDARRLKLAFMHILWRAHASQHESFISITLPKTRAERLRTLLLIDEAGPDDEFQVLMRCYDADPSVGIVKMMHGLIQTPTIWSLPNRSQCVMYVLGRWMIFITATAIPLPEQLRRFVLDPGRTTLAERGGLYQQSPMWTEALEAEIRRQQQRAKPPADESKANEEEL